MAYTFFKIENERTKIYGNDTDFAEIKNLENDYLTHEKELSAPAKRAIKKGIEREALEILDKIKTLGSIDFFNKKKNINYRNPKQGIDIYLEAEEEWLRTEINMKLEKKPEAISLQLGVRGIYPILKDLIQIHNSVVGDYKLKFCKESPSDKEKMIINPVYEGGKFLKTVKRLNNMLENSKISYTLYDLKRNEQIDSAFENTRKAEYAKGLLKLLGVKL